MGILRLVVSLKSFQIVITLMKQREKNPRKQRSLRYFYREALKI
jgi:hypothetical protein